MLRADVQRRDLGRVVHPLVEVVRELVERRVLLLQSRRLVGVPGRHVDDPAERRRLVGLVAPLRRQKRRLQGGLLPLGRRPLHGLLLLGFGFVRVFQAATDPSSRGSSRKCHTYLLNRIGPAPAPSGPASLLAQQDASAVSNHHLSYYQSEVSPGAAPHRRACLSAAAPRPTPGERRCGRSTPTWSRPHSSRSGSSARGRLSRDPHRPRHSPATLDPAHRPHTAPRRPRRAARRPRTAAAPSRRGQ